MLTLLIGSVCLGQTSETMKLSTLQQSPRLIDLIPDREYDPQILYYADKSYSGSIPIKVLETSKTAMVNFIDAIPETKIGYRYRWDKWTVGGVIQHIITYERIMMDRIDLILNPRATMRIPYYNQSTTVAGGKGKSKEVLLNEFTNTRNELISVIKRLFGEELRRIGTLDGFKVSIRAIVACASGHQHHHFQVISERYLDL